MSLKQKISTLWYFITHPKIYIASRSQNWFVGDLIVKSFSGDYYKMELAHLHGEVTYLMMGAWTGSGFLKQGYCTDEINAKQLRENNVYLL